MPSLSIAGCVFMIVAACFAHKMTVVWYLVIFAAVMALGAAFYKKDAAA
jgi:APA family basic amino acid/polyamine antiporter